MVRLISRQRGGLAVLKLTKLFGIDDKAKQNKTKQKTKQRKEE